MADDYGFAFNNASSSTTYRTAGLVAAASAAASGVQIRRGRLYEFGVGQLGSPSATDCDLQWDVSRITALGTVTSVTPNPLDGADAGFMGQAGSNATAEPTYTANSSLWNMALNQRAIFKQVFKDGKELVYPATANNGLGIRALVGVSSAYTGSIGGYANHTE